MNPLRVLFIAGLGRSGSTIVGRILGELPGAVCLGELHRVWSMGGVENRLCSCAEPWADCELWRAVRTRVPALAEVASAQGVVDWMKTNLRLRWLPALLAGGEDWLGRRGDYEAIVDSIRGLYAAIAAVTRARWIVDTSKDPLYAHFLSLLPGVELRVLQMVRDPRAASHSWRRVRRNPMTGEVAMRFGLVKSAALWTAWNGVVPAIGAGSDAPLPRARLRYEDFVADPERELGRITRFMDMDPNELPFVAPRLVRLGENHILSGSFERFQSGDIRIRPSEGWRVEMGPAAKMLVTTLTAPLLGRYGYPWRA